MSPTGSIAMEHRMLLASHYCFANKQDARVCAASAALASTRQHVPSSGAAQKTRVVVLRPISCGQDHLPQVRNTSPC